MAFMELIFGVFEHYSRSALLIWLALGCLAYISGLVIYRLYLSPIANFPGPKFTAITGLCQFYHDVIRGGQFTFVIQQWHEKYGLASSRITINQCRLTGYQGPIIRINPTEIHISDPDFYDTIYSHVPVNKEESFRYRLGNPGSMHSTPEKDLHHKRRASLASYFSRRQVLKFSPYIQTCMDKLCCRLIKEYKGTSKVVSLDDAFAAFTADIITYYAFARSYDFLSYPDSESPFIRAIENLSDSMQILAYLPWLIPMVEFLPKFLSSAIQPAIVPFTEYRDVSVDTTHVSESKANVLMCCLRRSKLRYVKRSIVKTKIHTGILNTKQTTTSNMIQYSRRFSNPICQLKN